MNDELIKIIKLLRNYENKKCNILVKREIKTKNRKKRNNKISNLEEKQT